MSVEVRETGVRIAEGGGGDKDIVHWSVAQPVGGINGQWSETPALPSQHSLPSAPPLCYRPYIQIQISNFYPASTHSHLSRR